MKFQVHSKKKRKTKQVSFSVSHLLLPTNRDKNILYYIMTKNKQTNNDYKYDGLRGMNCAYLESGNDRNSCIFYIIARDVSTYI